jgi:hypothetical protein
MESADHQRECPLIVNSNCKLEHEQFLGSMCRNFYLREIVNYFWAQERIYNFWLKRKYKKFDWIQTGFMLYIFPYAKRSFHDSSH